MCVWGVRSLGSMVRRAGLIEKPRTPPTGEVRAARNDYCELMGCAYVIDPEEIRNDAI